jgi:hypothetical protein
VRNTAAFISDFLCESAFSVLGQSEIRT